MAQVAVRLGASLGMQSPPWPGRSASPPLSNTSPVLTFSRAVKQSRGRAKGWTVASPSTGRASSGRRSSGGGRPLAGSQRGAHAAAGMASVACPEPEPLLQPRCLAYSLSPPSAAPGAGSPGVSAFSQLSELSASCSPPAAAAGHARASPAGLQAAQQLLRGLSLTPRPTPAVDSCSSDMGSPDACRSSSGSYATAVSSAVSESPVADGLPPDSPCSLAWVPTPGGASAGAGAASPLTPAAPGALGALPGQQAAWTPLPTPAGMQRVPAEDICDPHTPWLPATSTKHPVAPASPGCGGCNSAGSTPGRSGSAIVLSSCSSESDAEGHVWQVAGSPAASVDNSPCTAASADCAGREQQQQHQAEEEGVVQAASADSADDGEEQAALVMSLRRRPGAARRIIDSDDSDSGAGQGCASSDSASSGRSSGSHWSSPQRRQQPWKPRHPKPAPPQHGKEPAQQQQEAPAAGQPLGSSGASRANAQPLAQPPGGGAAAGPDRQENRGRQGRRGPGPAGKASTAGPKLAAAPGASPTTVVPVFGRRRARLAQQLYGEWNQLVFDGRLPAGLPLVWNPRLLSTAGQVVDDRSQDHAKADRRTEKVPCRLELSPKVLTSEARLRDTLSHEMCHVAAWALDRDFLQHHGPTFARWARRFEALVPGVTITTRHTYDINHKHTWECIKCAKEYKRQRKVIDPGRHVCSDCAGRLVYREPAAAGGEAGGGGAAKRPGNEYSQWVKANFADMRGSLPPGTPAREVMRQLGSAWKAQDRARTLAAVLPAGSGAQAGAAAATEPAPGGAVLLPCAAGSNASLQVCL